MKTISLEHYESEMLSPQCQNYSKVSVINTDRRQQWNVCYILYYDNIGSMY